MVKRDALGHVIVETVPYLVTARNEGIGDDEREEIAGYISANPTMGEIIQGTGGARKASAAGRGKVKAADIASLRTMRLTIDRRSRFKYMEKTNKRIYLKRRKRHAESTKPIS
jgi:hypothetical protein